jgi:hypothetical protein
VFSRSGSSWSAEAHFKAPRAGTQNRFGEAVSLSGDTIAVGAKGESSCSTSIVNGVSGYATDAGCSAAGAVYIFVRAGSEWTAQAYIKAPNAGVSASQYFGYSVSLDSGTLVAGAWGEAGCSVEPRAADGASAADYNDDCEAVGWMGEDRLRWGCGDDCTSDGAAWVFTRSGASWHAQSYLKALNGSPKHYWTDDEFGFTVAVDGSTVAVGARYEDSCTKTITNRVADVLSSEYLVADGSTGLCSATDDSSGCHWAINFFYVLNQTVAECTTSCNTRSENGLFGGTERRVCRETCASEGSSPSSVQGAVVTADNQCTQAGAAWVFLLPPSPPSPPPSPPDEAGDPPLSSSPPPSPPCQDNKGSTWCEKKLRLHAHKCNYPGCGPTAR